jgi:hypothetical protein
MESRRYLVVLTILLPVLAAVTLTACGGTPSLVGKWQHIEGSAYIEFFNDGQMEMGDNLNTISGTYEETLDKEITVILTSVNGEALDEEEQVVLEYSFSGDELTLTDGENPETFRRVK